MNYQINEPLKGVLYVLYNIIKTQKRVTLSQEKLAEKTGYNERTIREAIACLRNIGLITAQRRNQREPYTYEVIL